MPVNNDTIVNTPSETERLALLTVKRIDALFATVGRGDEQRDKSPMRGDFEHLSEASLTHSTDLFCR